LIASIALDLGTTSIKAGLLDQHGELSNLVIRHAPKINANGGHYESDALAYAETAEHVLNDCIAPAGDCKTLGLCSQRSSFLVWEQSTSQPFTALISWQDNRGAASCVALRTHENVIRNLTGLALTPYYFAPKLRVLLQDNPGWQARLESGELLAGTLDTFLIWRLTGGRHFVTDASMATRTLLMDIRQQQWSPQLCDLFGIPSHILPEIKPSVGMNIQLMKPLAIRLGHQKTMAKSLVMDNGLILQASVGDQSAALFARRQRRTVRSAGQPRHRLFCNPLSARRKGSIKRLSANSGLSGQQTACAFRDRGYAQLCRCRICSVSGGRMHCR